MKWNMIEEICYITLEYTKPVSYGILQNFTFYS